MATYFIKKDKDGYFYWTLRSDNNFKTVAMSSESYNTKQGAVDSVAWTQNNANTKKIEEN
jgi:uncharacterized protein YegP (UPF0339 family)